MISLSKFALNLVLRPNPEVIAKRLDQTTVLVDISTSRIFELNETGTRIWELLGQGLNVERSSSTWFRNSRLKTPKPPKN